jgi:hypothetical protein
MDAKRIKCSHEVEMYENSKLVLKDLEKTSENLWKKYDDLLEVFKKKERDLNRDINKYLVLYRGYQKFIKKMPPPVHILPEFSPVKMALKSSKLTEKFEKECKARNEIMEEYRINFAKDIVSIDIARCDVSHVNNERSVLDDKIVTAEIEIARTLRELMMC